MTLLECAKEKLLIPELATLRGWNWQPGRECHCPYRPDKNPSGSVLPDGRLFHDFASGETIDAPALLARVEGIENRAACLLFIELAGVKPSEWRGDTPPARQRQGRQLPALAVENRETNADRGRPELPVLRPPSAAHLRALADLRGLGIEGPKLAARRGLLYLARFRGLECWALTDKARCLCQLRRLDGELFTRAGGYGYKAHTCRGSQQSWPLGIREAGKALGIALVEGGGDFLAAWHFIAVEQMERHVAPVAMLGASHRIAAEALLFFAGKSVRIFAHVDKPNPRGEHPGIEAAARWEAQLIEAGATVSTFDLSGLTRADGEPAKDLNDLARVSVEDFEREPELSALMCF